MRDKNDTSPSQALVELNSTSPETQVLETVPIPRGNPFELLVDLGEDDNVEHQQHLLEKERLEQAQKRGIKV